MDKYEYRIRAEEINALIEKKQFVEAVKIADTIDWSRVKSVMMLCKVSELYKYVRRFEDAKEILLLAYDRQPGGRKIVYSLCELCIKLEETVQAVEYYKEFVQVAPTDTRRFILQYRLYEAQDVSLEERIAVLEEYKKRDYREKWAYELAYLYHRIGLATRCVEECDELILWFGEGKYVNMAMELKMLHAPLSPSQQEKYDRRFMKEEPQEEVEKEAEDQTLSIEIKSVDATKAKTTEIISDSVREALNAADTIEVPDLNVSSEQAEEEEVSEAEEQQTEEAPAEEDSDAKEENEPEEIPLVDPDLDIQIKTVDVGEYNTINLQQELAQNISRMFAEEDMEAADATMALPIESILNTTSQRGRVIQSISDDAIKDAILAPLLEETEESTQITEEDLLASLAQERMEKEEAERLEAERLEAERLEAERLEAERKEAERQETARLEAERIEAERKEAERLEAERLEAERKEAERLEAERLEAERKEAERLEAERLEAERKEAERLEAERLEAERREAERLEAERLEAERLEAERLEAERQAAAPATAGAIMAAEIAHAVTTGNTGSLNIGSPKFDTGNISLDGKSLTGDPMIDEQISGQLSLLDIMNEWEETKKANEEKRIAQMREKVMKQTGPMFTNFDEVARASVTANLDLINPVVDVFKHEDAMQEQTPAKAVDLSDVEEVATEVAQEPSEEKAEEPRKALNTEEINGLEEKLLEVLKKTEAQQEDNQIASFVPDLDFSKEEPKQEEVPDTQERVIISEEVETTGVSALAAMMESHGSDMVHKPAEEAVIAPEMPIPPVVSTPIVETLNTPEMSVPPVVATPIVETFSTPEVPVPPVATTPIIETLSTPEMPVPPVATTPIVETLSTPEVPVSPVVPTPIIGAVSTPDVPVSPIAPTPIIGAVSTPEVSVPPVAPMQAMEPFSTPEVPVSPVVSTPVQAIEPFSAPEVPVAPVVATPIVEAANAPGMVVPPVAPAVSPYSQPAQPVPPVAAPGNRLLTREEKELFGKIAPIKDLQVKVAHAIDFMSLAMGTGNVLVTGDDGTDRLSIAKNMVKCMQLKDPSFSGKVAKIKGDLFSTKDIAATLTELENGALIIEEASTLESDILANLLYYLDRLQLRGILVVLEDTKEELDKLMHTYPQMDRIFSSRIEIEVLDNDGLVEFAKTYANSLEYSIDDMGVLAIYTRISDMQTNEHAVTIKEVKCMVNDAIDHAEKKNVKHFVDVLFGKRFNDEDMIILRESDFSIE